MKIPAGEKERREYFRRISRMGERLVASGRSRRSERSCAQAIADATKQHYTTWVSVARELRKGVELLAKLTGELDPWSLGPEDGKVEVRINYVDKPLPEPARPAGQIIEALPAPTEDKH
jgi:hypothetical protein